MGKKDRVGRLNPPTQFGISYSVRTLQQATSYMGLQGGNSRLVLPKEKYLTWKMRKKIKQLLSNEEVILNDLHRFTKRKNVIQQDKDAAYSLIRHFIKNQSWTSKQKILAESLVYNKTYSSNLEGRK